MLLQNLPVQEFFLQMSSQSNKYFNSNIIQTLDFWFYEICKFMPISLDKSSCA